jgi:DNA-binding GntR family transcriptional regulator
VVVNEPERTPILLPSVTDMVYEQLRRDIARGVYRPGPISLKPVSERFGTSVIPVREALRRLEAEGLVSFDGRRRIHINALDERELDETFAIRGELEPLALRRAVPRLMHDEPTLATLDGLIEQMDQQEEDPDAWRETNHRFHSTIYAAADMPRLTSIVSSLWVASDPYLRIYTATTGLHAAQEEHRELVRCIRRGDAQRGEVVLRKHLSSTWEVVQEQMHTGDGISQDENADL